jgi:type IV secretory pathway TrbL component
VLVVLWVEVVEVVLVGAGLLVVLLVTGVAPPLALVLVLPLEPQPTATAAMRASAAIAATARYENHDQLWRSIDSSCSTS